MVTAIQKSPLFEIAEIELVYRPTKRASSRPVITRPADIYDVMKSTWNLDQIELKEEFKIILLNTANRILGILEISSGGISKTTVDPRLIFAAALKANAVSIILVHNHPSGNLKPSNSDISLTQKIKEIGTLLKIKVIDHLIISNEGYLSMVEEGLL